MHTIQDSQWREGANRGFNLDIDFGILVIIFMSHNTPGCIYAFHSLPLKFFFNSKTTQIYFIGYTPRDFVDFTPNFTPSCPHPACRLCGVKRSLSVVCRD